MRYIPYILFCLICFASCDDRTKKMSGYEVHGIDISHYQSFINWDTVATQGVRFAFMKATEGRNFVDTMFCHNWESTQRVGIKRGAYHFFRPTLNARTQAINFCKNVTLRAGDLPPVLDVEVVDGATKAEVIKGMRTWLDMTEIHYGIRPIIYTNLKFYNKYLVGHFDEYPMWIARYNDYSQPKLAAGKNWDFWQYGNRGRIKGIKGNVDFNVFHGSILELEEMTVAERTVWAR